MQRNSKENKACVDTRSLSHSQSEAEERGEFAKWASLDLLRRVAAATTLG
jgi:hypothetical protein